jgi:hypothetical protein
MFGHDDHKDQDDDIATINPTVTTDENTVSDDTSTSDDSAMAADSSASSDMPAMDTPTVTSTDEPDVVTETTEEVTEDTPATDDTPEVVTTTEETTTSDSAGDMPEVTTTEETTAYAPTTSSPAMGGSDDLLELKKSALEELAPLVDQLDQSPEEKFKTTMMMIQATDAADLVKVAHEAAQQITDEKARAQALLDIVNEINYFTQKDAK